MVTLLRRMREQLIAEGKVRKYLLYAIGEILLVVIGILIALQINNRNEEIKTQKELVQYLGTIQSNLESDIVVLDSLIIRRQRTIYYAQKTRLAFLNKEFDFQTTRNGLSAYVDYYFVANTSGYEALKNSTYLGLLNGTGIDKQLVSYYAKVAEIAQREKSYNEFVEALEVRMGSVTDRSLIMAYIFMEPEEIAATRTTQDQIIEVFKEVFESSGYRNIVSQAAVGESTVQLYKDLKSIGDQIIHDIDRFTGE